LPASNSVKEDCMSSRRTLCLLFASAMNEALLQYSNNQQLQKSRISSTERVPALLSHALLGGLLMLACMHAPGPVT
jgi:hypothetical protein